MLKKGLRQRSREGSFYSAVNPPSPNESAALAEQMPELAGWTLEAPRFHLTGWHVNQRFTAADDPDRTRLPWVPPKFVSFRDPGAQKVDVEEMKGPDHGSFARVVRNILSEEDCAALIASVNMKGYTPALLNIGRGSQQLVPGARDGHRVIVDSTELAQWLFQVLLPYLPTVLDDGSRLVELNERCRFLCYTPGQQFPAHCDGCFERLKGHPRAGDFSFVTVQLYLHDVPSSHGGATTFLLEGKPKHQPEAGSALLFTQDLMHEGSLVERGLKYTLRTEAMYSRPGSRLPGPPRDRFSTPPKQVARAGQQDSEEKADQSNQKIDAAVVIPEEGDVAHV